MDNRHVVQVRFVDGLDGVSRHQFILDSGALISTMSKSTALNYEVYNANVVNKSAVVGGFNNLPMPGRVIMIEQLYIGIMGIKNTLFFVPDSDTPIAEVLGASVLNALVPIPDYENEQLWIWKNTCPPKAYHSRTLGVTIEYNVLAQSEYLPEEGKG
jgi:hypothetical protein